MTRHEQKELARLDSIRDYRRLNPKDERRYQTLMDMYDNEQEMKGLKAYV